MKRICYVLILIFCVSGLQVSNVIIAKNFDAISKNEAPDVQSIQSQRSSWYQNLKFPSFQNFEQIKQFFGQRVACLLNYKYCSHRELLLLNWSFGFATGYGASIVLFDYLTKKVSSLPGLGAMPIQKAIALTAFYLRTLLPKGILTGKLSPLNSKYVESQLTTFLSQFIDIKNQNTAILKDFAIAEAKNYIINESVKYSTNNLPEAIKTILQPDLNNMLKLIFQLAFEAVAIADEMRYMATFSPQNSFFSNMYNYLKMNMNCIWSLDYCTSRYGSPDGRRQGLYFWLGFMAGRLARIKKG